MSEKSCHICKKQLKTSAYVCPRCQIEYCSADCYKSKSHSQCSEGFFRDSVLNEVKTRQTEGDKRPNVIIEAMKKLEKSAARDYSDDVDFDGDLQPEFEESDEEDVSYCNVDLSKVDLDQLDEGELDAQLKQLGLDSSDPEKLLAALTDAERAALEDLLGQDQLELIEEKKPPKYSQPFPSKSTAPLSKRTVVEEIE